MQERRAKIADVGMAQIMSEDHYASLNSQQGTFAWASPELILREGRCGTFLSMQLHLTLPVKAAPNDCCLTFKFDYTQGVMCHAGARRKWTSTR